MADTIVQGGMFICRPKTIFVPNKRTYTETGFRLISDLHIGARNIDYDLIDEELRDAKKKGDRIAINGDVLDMILVQDKKRWRTDCIHPSLEGKADLVNAAIDWAVKILSPYADIIDMIGVGNHEEAVLKHHSTDVTKNLVYDLSRKRKDPEHVIHYGGYCGFLPYSFCFGKRSSGEQSSRRLTIFYHHGAGGSAPVTRGMIDLHRFGGWVNADVIWMGHKHTRICSSVQTISCPVTGDHPIVREVRQVITGSYFDTYKGQTQEEVKEYGRVTNYAADRGMAPQGKGGARLVALTTDPSTPIKMRLEQ